MKLFPFCVSLTLFISLYYVSYAQTHFQVVYTGSGVDHMNINILEAKIGDTNLSSGDEIGIFDGTLCVGSVQLSGSLGSLEDQQLIQAVVSRADEGGDGYTIGDEIIYKLWDASVQIEYDNIVASYYDNQINPVVAATYEIGASTFVSLTGVVNQPPVAEVGNDISIDENNTGQLNGSGSYDPEGSILAYLWRASEELSVENPNQMITDFVSPEVDADQEFWAILTVTDQVGNFDSDTILITVRNINKAPVANAGADQQVAENVLVELDGTGSYDPDGDQISYLWSSINNVPLSSETSPNPTFISPVALENQIYGFALVVFDGNIYSETDTVFVNIVHENEAPIADAGDDISLDENTQGQLNGTSSYDPDGNPLTYLWTVPDGFILDNPSSPTTSFTAPEVNSDTDFYIILRVNDGVLSSLPDTVIVTVRQINRPPVANAGADQQVAENVLVELDGTGSYDPDGDQISYLWSSINNVPLSSETSPNPTFISPVALENQIYGFALVVFDGNIYSETDTVFVSIVHENEAPIADAGNDISLDENTQGQLDGTSSYDPDGNPLTYLWTVPVGFILDNPSSPTTSFTAPEVNSDTDFNIILRVNDGILGSQPDTVIVTVRQINRPPVANAGNSFVVREQKNASLNGSSSYDPDDDPITFNWGGPADVPLNNSNTINPSFVSPSVSSNRMLSFLLTVSDGDLESNDTVYVEVTPNQIPVADAGENQTKHSIEIVTLDGSGSSDLDDDDITFHWTAPDGISLNSNSVEKPRFTAPIVQGTSDYRFNLTVSDDLSTSETKSVTVTVIGNQPPVADAGEDQYVAEGDTVYLSGEGSYDPDGDPIQSYNWETREAIILENSSARECHFIAPEVDNNTVLLIRLTVNDGSVNSSLDSVYVTVFSENNPPVAIAGNDFTINENSSGQLNASSSYDPDGDNLLYHWIIPQEFGATNTSNAVLSFTSPEVSAETDILCIVEVSDGILKDKDSVIVKVLNTNNPPEIFSFEVAGNEDEEINVFFNATDDKDNFSKLKFEVVRKPEHCIFKSHVFNLAVFIPHSDFFGSDSLTYKVQDLDGAWSEEATVFLDIQPVNDAPVAQITVIDAGQKSEWTIDFTSLISDIDNSDQQLIVALNSCVNGGTLTHVQGNTYLYDIGTNSTGADIFTFRAYDGELYSNLGMVLINNLSTSKSASFNADATIVAVDDSLQVDYGKTRSIDLIGVDMAVPLTQLEISIEKEPEYGKLENIGFAGCTNGMITCFQVDYTPEVNETRLDSVVFKVSDGESSAFGVIHISINSGKAAPIVEPIPAIHGKVNTTVKIPIECNDDDRLSDLYYYLNDQSNLGFIHQFLIEGESLKLQLTPPKDYIGTTELSVRIEDMDKLSTIRSFLVVFSENNLPEFVSTPVANAYSGHSYTYNIEVMDADADDVVSITSVELPGWLSLLDNHDGTAVLTGTPPATLSPGEYQIVINTEDGNMIDPVQQVYKLNLGWMTATEINELSDFSVYPNPTSGKINIRFDQFSKTGTIIQVFDARGTKLLEKFTLNKTEQLDISSYSFGIYFIKVVSKELIKTHKIILTKTNQ